MTRVSSRDVRDFVAVRIVQHHRTSSVCPHGTADANGGAGLFANLPHDSLRRLFARLDGSTYQTPHAGVRVARSQELLPVPNYGCDSGSTSRSPPIRSRIDCTYWISACTEARMWQAAKPGRSASRAFNFQVFFVPPGPIVVVRCPPVPANESASMAPKIYLMRRPSACTPASSKRSTRSSAVSTTCSAARGGRTTQPPAGGSSHVL